ncbi:hypothetical protein [Agrococcus sp. SCSIO52902]|uniref:hypothetical protein n=1 Tax=Agrococcus sp. SCSIO52902 TaxID=2933290 RepID=UPI001FF6314D|nr:hypothetical protein [Agrococcus sp. SCSIO52902]UOW01361.1 hypothetical protein MU522_02790 [Agrococcus sp. SCSIO52902]
MPSRMPEFEMPPEPPAGVVDDAPDRVDASEASAAEPQPAPDADRSGSGAARRRLIAGVILAALLVVGGSTAAIVQAVQRQAETADTAALTELALDYLGAIADGRADDATALVPVEGDAPLLTDAALTAADRTRRFDVAAVELDGDAAAVLVELSGGPGRIERQLAAVRDPDGWRLTTSLAERVVLEQERGVGVLPRLLGVEIGGVGGTLLYPGLYRTEPIDEGLVSIEPSTIRVDGDPATPAETGLPAWRASEGLIDEARRLALAHGVACQAASSCPAPAGALLGLGDTAQLQIADDGALELDVPLRALAEGSAAPADLWMGVRATARDGGGVDFACTVRQTRVGATATPEAEVPPEWQPCG